MSRLRGVSHLRKTLRRLPDDITDGVRLALLVSAQEVTDEAKQRAPVMQLDGGKTKKYRGKKRRPGTLRACISWGWKNSDKLSVQIGIRGKKAKRAAFYAVFIEFGTRFMRAQPFLFPALEAKRAIIIQRMQAAVKKALDTATSGAGSDDD